MKTRPHHSSAFLTETAARLGIRSSRLAVAVRAAEQLTQEELGLVEDLLSLGSSTGIERRRAIAEGLRQVLADQRQVPSDDPLGEVDDPIEAGEAAGAVLWADLEARTNRTRLLRDCVTSAEAGRLTGRSRQAIEKLRREARILALRLGRQWRYPRWQLDGDSPGGVIAEIPQILRLLHLSPTGAALWLTSTKPELDGATPLQRLQNHDTETVLQLAEQHGHLP